MKKIRVLLVVCSSILLGCENDSSDQKMFSIPATIRDLTGFNGCRYVFELEDGLRLEPILPAIFGGTAPLPKEITEDPLYNYDFEDGKQVLISYIEKPRPSICMIGPTIKITCITEVNQPQNE